MSSIATAIQNEARHLGFILAGFTTPTRPPHANVYETWLDQGRQADMAYLSTGRARLLRSNPTSVFPGVKSILLLGIPYALPQSLPFPEDKEIHGRVASYAWGVDYHDVVPGKLKQLGEFISRNFGASAVSRGFTDTAPILERDLAQRAGLGWIGKNTCLIDPRRGSYFLLAELFLTLDLEPDPPFSLDRCGSCTRCIQACPTGCILPDRTLDAGRCISYLTIEKKGPIAKDLRPLMGQWVFGCDVCQLVCPWNIRFSSNQGDLSFEPQPDVPFPDLVKELELGPHEFNRKFKHSPVQRPHRRGYLRNVAIALGNSHNPTGLAALAQALETDPEPLVRGAAAWAIQQIDAGDKWGFMAKAAGSENDLYVLSEILPD